MRTLLFIVFVLFLSGCMRQKYTVKQGSPLAETRQWKTKKGISYFSYEAVIKDFVDGQLVDCQVVEVTKEKKGKSFVITRALEVGGNHFKFIFGEGGFKVYLNDENEPFLATNEMTLKDNILALAYNGSTTEDRLREFFPGKKEVVDKSRIRLYDESGSYVEYNPKEKIVTKMHHTAEDGSVQSDIYLTYSVYQGVIILTKMLTESIYPTPGSEIKNVFRTEETLEKILKVEYDTKDNSLTL